MGKLQDELGQEVVTLLSGAAGGRLISVPMTYTKGSKIDRTFGPTLAIVLIDNFPGDRIYIPMHPSVAPQKGGNIKTRRVVRLHKSGRTAEQIASHLKTTVRTVRNHLQKAREKPRKQAENKQ